MRIRSRCFSGMEKNTCGDLVSQFPLVSSLRLRSLKDKIPVISPWTFKSEARQVNQFKADSLGLFQVTWSVTTLMTTWDPQFLQLLTSWTVNESLIMTIRMQLRKEEPAGHCLIMLQGHEELVKLILYQGTNAPRHSLRHRYETRNSSVD